jgi:hypothetical protein
MVGATNVMTRNDGDEGSSAILGSRLQTTERVGLDSSARTVTIALGLHTSVDTSGVAAPELNICVCDRFAA